MSRQDTDRLIINEFCKLYQTKPIGKITVKELVHNCHINRTTFYKHFYDVYDVRDQLEEEFIQNFKNAISENLHMKSDDLVANLTECFPQALDKNKSYLNVLIAHNPNAPHTINHLFHELVPFYREILHVEKSKEADSVLTFYTAGFCSFFMNWNNDDQDLSTSEMTDLLARILSQGLLSVLKEYIH